MYVLMAIKRSDKDFPEGDSDLGGPYARDTHRGGYGDDYASARHARIEPRRDGVWVEDIGSTNGTFLNGIKLTRPRKLTPGDVVRIGETEVRYET